MQRYALGVATFIMLMMLDVLSLRCQLLEVKGRGFVCMHYLMGGFISNLGP
jgi:hypothetical protein